VIGYPAKKLQSPKIVPKAHATSPWAYFSRDPRTFMTR